MPNGKSEAEALKDIDDPYQRLAYIIVCRNDIPTINRYLKEYKFVRRTVVREVKELDLNGPFLDCLSVAMNKESDRSEMLRQMGTLGGFFYNKLDLQRLRREIRNACDKLGIGDLIIQPE